MAQKNGASALTGLSKLNSGILVVNPSDRIFDKITAALKSDKTTSYQFPDQDLLADVFHGRWVPIPYIYNALKPMRSPQVHGAIWRDECVKIVHFILVPKPWNERPGEESNETHKWWWDLNGQRVSEEKKKGLADLYATEGPYSA
jgi:lipopolysaccharide biosynthesis glycosyltransferase